MLSIVAAIAAMQTVEPVQDVEIRSGAVVFIERWPDGKEVREAFVFNPLADIEENETTPFDNCVAAARVACGFAGIARLKFTQGPGDQASCEFECKPGAAPPPPQ